MLVNLILVLICIRETSPGLRMGLNYAPLFLIDPSIAATVLCLESILENLQTTDDLIDDSLVIDSGRSVAQTNVDLPNTALLNSLYNGIDRREKKENLK